ncbi:MAG: penicillin-binding transpeptidase domain-containing protein [Lachnospiraceae bacterium]
MKIKQVIKKIGMKRSYILLVVFAAMAVILIQKLFVLQIIQGEEYTNSFTTKIKKTRSITSTRGNILDRNGEVLASNQLSYSLTLEDNGTYSTTRESNLTLNSVAYKLLGILQKEDDTFDTSFHIIINDMGGYEFDVSGTSLQRFRADIYGESSIDDMTTEQANASASDMMKYLSGSERFCVVLTGDNAYTSEELAEYGLPEELTQNEILQITRVRYELSTNSFRKYVPVTLATDVSSDTVASIMENKDSLQGVDIAEDTIRYYEDSVYFANILGYTGKASSEELSDLQEESDNYSSTSIIGKTGIEQYEETQLQGVDGEETVYVDNLGKVLQIDDSATVEPVAGNNVYLSIDKNLQIAVYKIIEQRLAAILVDNIIDARTFDAESVSDTTEIRIPIYDVYNALVGNSVIDIDHFSAEDASGTEQALYAAFQQKQTSVFATITEQLTGDTTTAYKDLPEETQEYMDYIINDLLIDRLGILSQNAIDTTDKTYIAWNTDQSISAKEFLTYAASQNWIDISQIDSEGDYLDSNEVYSFLTQYITEYLNTDTQFNKILYKYMLHEDAISPAQLCTVLYDQGILDAQTDSLYATFISGGISTYDFMIQQIQNLKITPAQLALDPYSASAVVTDPNTGEVLACVSYPGYDNNKLANTMDTGYYYKLVNDASQPLFNKATQQKTAPGSTFKLVSAIAGMQENVITSTSTITCNGVFDLVSPSIQCYGGTAHGSLDLISAIEQSCNVYFTTVGYRLGLTADNTFSETQSLAKLEQYASLMDLDKKSGVEISEASPQVSDSMAVPSYIGQGTHLYTTSGLARYVSTLANSGTSYKLSLLDKLTDANGNVITDYTPEVESTISLSDELWNDLHTGMREVVQLHSEMSEIGVDVAGKTGTAQESEVRPDHGLFVGYAPYDNPTMSLAVRIPYGYSSGNATLIASDIFKYSFSEDANVITGTASETTSMQSLD